LGITAALLSCIVLLAVLALCWYTVLSIRGPAVPTPNSTGVPARSPTAGAVGTPRPLGTSGPVQSATPSAIRTPDSADVDSLNVLLKTVVKERDLITLTHRLKKVTQPIPIVVNATPPSFKTGDQRVLWVADQPNKKNFTTTATLRYVTPHVYAWVQNSERVDDGALKKSADTFETKIYPTDRQFFGSEWSPGIDNDVHVNIFNGNVPGVGGYYSSADEYASIVNQFSNQGEWFYINVRDVRPGTADYEGVLAHEFQHMIHWNNDRNEDTWVNEGLSELAMRLNGYSVGGSDNAFIHDTDVQLNAWRDQPNDAVPHYGASFLFNAYFLERFGDKMMQQVVRNQANGIEGYENALASNNTGLKFDDVFQDWLIANVLNDPAVDKRFAYKDLRTKTVSQSTAASYPYNKTLLVHQYAAQYIDLKAPSRPGDYTLTLKGDTAVRIAPTTPHSGKFLWYSNRGDDSDMTLTRAFDLSAVSKATLDAWLWYDIEKDFDYAYVEVSIDGGTTWDTLAGQHTTTTNPNGNNFGNALNGTSGQWVEERFDLSRYAGKPVLVRFEYITDDAYNATGLVVDDISIPELNYKDDVEAGQGGWEADGFVRVDNFLPETFSIQLIKFGSKTTVEKVTLDASNTALVTLKNFGTDISHVILVVSGLAPVTTEASSFTVSIKPQ
jgi:immune inhibitor A